jgi:glucose 1-dehydrogenase
MKLAQKKVLVTGADSGIGRAIAVRFAQEGADVAVHYRSDDAGAAQTVEAIRGAGRRAEAFQADVGIPAEAQALFSSATGFLDGIDVLVNCAGKSPSMVPALELPLEEFEEMLRVNLTGPWVLTQAAARHMVTAGGGSIVNVTSVHEEIVSPGGSAYEASKAGLRSVTRAMALELASKGVRVNNIAPGMIRTEMTADRLDDPQKAREAMAQIPMGRPGEAREVANVAVFLASDESSYVTGSSYFVDGGLMVHIGGA